MSSWFLEHPSHRHIFLSSSPEICVKKIEAVLKILIFNYAIFKICAFFIKAEDKGFQTNKI